MRKTKVAVTLEAKLVQQLDELVAERRYPNRSQAIETAVAEKLARTKHTRLARECAKLEPREEKALAEEGLASDLTAWPEY
jgi:metal-responsive CopG/Arc/MetJ family transcriptional regulator